MIFIEFNFTQNEFVGHIRMRFQNEIWCKFVLQNKFTPESVVILNT